MSTSNGIFRYRIKNSKTGPDRYTENSANGVLNSSFKLFFYTCFFIKWLYLKHAEIVFWIDTKRTFNAIDGIFESVRVCQHQINE